MFPLQQSRRELYVKYQDKWMKKLSDKKKWKYIEMAIEAKKKYDVSVNLQLYCFIAAQVSQPVLFKWIVQLGQFGRQ